MFRLRRKARPTVQEQIEKHLNELNKLIQSDIQELLKTVDDKCKLMARLVDESESSFADAWRINTESLNNVLGRIERLELKVQGAAEALQSEPQRPDAVEFPGAP